ncbi:general substrate transporter [Pestalotiopsis sp. NC0098]|nr:general substrate transporter [Pestalotiopsis sp. NC0098]
MLGMSTHVTFDEHNPSSSGKGAEHVDGPTAALDYSPLPRLTGRSLCMGALVSMGGLIFGYDTGQISGFLEMPDFLERFGERSGDSYSFSNVRSGLVVGLLSIGTLIGALMAAPIADRIGRRISICLWCIVVSVGFVIQVAAVTAWEQIMIGRLVAGFGVGALSLLVPMYQSETAPPWIRGALVCAYQLFITMGIFLAACFNYGTYTHQMHSSASWRIVIGLGWIWTIILGVGMLAFSETPRFDYRRGRIEEAKQTLMKVYGAPANHYAIHVQMEEIGNKLRAETQTQGGFVRNTIEMFQAPRMSYRIVIGMLLQMFQQLTGANYFFYYGTTIFKSVQISSFVTQMILNAINFGVTFIGLYMVEHYGRRKSLISGSIWMFICFMIFASVGHFLLDLDNPTNTPTAGIVLIVFACLFILGYATTWGPMVWTLIAEIYPSRYRAKAMALATASNWTWNFLIAFFTPFITSAIDFRYGYVFAACNLVGGALVYFFVLEGQGRTLEEIDTMYVEHVSPMKSSKWVAPPPEEMEKIRKEAGTEVSTPPPEGNNGGVLEGR